MKPREEPPPGPYLRSAGGTPAELHRTTRTDHTGRLWIFRLDYGNVLGTQEWTLPQLLQLPGLTWLQRRPRDLPERAA